MRKVLNEKEFKKKLQKDNKTISDYSISGLALYKTKTGYVWRLNA